ncbi:MAG TPA: hypothetical protein VI039_00230 [Solirubrobacterales bacterium]
MQTMAPPEDALTERFARLDERFDRTDERIAEVDRRITETSAAINRRITETSAAINHRLDNVETEVSELKQGMKSLHEGIHRATIAIWIASAGVIAAILANGG